MDKRDEKEKFRASLQKIANLPPSTNEKNPLRARRIAIAALGGNMALAKFSSKIQRKHGK